jgi:acyl carrier protein
VTPARRDTRGWEEQEPEPAWKPPLAGGKKPPELSESALLRDLAGFAQELGGVDPGLVTPRSSFREDLGLDSLDLIEIIMMIEDRFAIEISDEDAQNIETVGDGIRYLRRRLA